MIKLFYINYSKIRCLLIMLLFPVLSFGQHPSATINLSQIDGIDITPDNIFNFQVYSTLGASNYALIKGVIHYRNSNLSLSYSFHYTLRQGLNMISADMVSPQWQFSSS